MRNRIGRAIYLAPATTIALDGPKRNANADETQKTESQKKSESTDDFITDTDRDLTIDQGCVKGTARGWVAWFMYGFKCTQPLNNKLLQYNGGGTSTLGTPTSGIGATYRGIKIPQ